MSTFRLRRFSSPSVLRSIQREHLIGFLAPHAAFFTSREVDLPDSAGDEEIDYDRLVRVFMTPDTSTPRPLIDALFLVDEMSTEEGMHALLEEVERLGHTLAGGDEPTPAEVAVHVWLLDSDILERRHAQQFLWRSSSFEYFQSERGDVAFTPPTSAQRAALEEDLDDWFESKRRGRGARVFVFPDDQEVWFLIRHGEPFKREESLQGAEVASVCYRPLKYDVVVFDRRLGELKINAQLVGEKKLYRTKFGEHIFGDPDCFPGTRKYTLEPLKEYGADALACGDVEGIESITLTEVHMAWGGAYREIEIRKADDVFAGLEARGRELPESARIIRAVFKVKFEGDTKPRTVKVRPSNIADYTRDSDATLVEQWLELRGFMVTEEHEEHEPVAAILAGD